MLESIGLFFANIGTQGAALATAIIGGAIIAKSKDWIISKVLLFINPDKYIDMLVRKIGSAGDSVRIEIEKIDVKYLDPFKAKHPASGAIVEKALAKALRETGKALKTDFDQAAKDVLDQ